MVTRRWSFENISTDLIELDWVNNRLTFDHDNIEIDTKVFSFGKSRRSVWRKAIKTPQINFRIKWEEFGAPGRQDEKYWILIEDDLIETEKKLRNKAKRTAKAEKDVKIIQPEKERNIEIIDNKDGSKTIFLDGIQYLPIENKDVEMTQTEKELEMTQSEKDALHEKFESILIDPTFLYMRDPSKLRTKEILLLYFKPSLIKKLKIRPTGKLGPYLNWPLTTLAEMFQITLNSPNDRFYSLAEIFLAWSESIDKGPPGEQQFQGVITNEVTNLYFGVSPGFPQFIIMRNDSTNIDGSLIITKSIRFDSYTYDDNGRILPNDISTGYPSSPRREDDVPIPLVISYQKKSQLIEEQVRGAIMDEKGDIDLQKLPVSLVGLRTDNWPDEKKFIEAMKTISRKLGFKIVFDIKSKELKWPTTYKYILSWCLAYVDEGPPPGIVPEKNTAYVRSFPIYMPPRANLGKRNFGFCWFHSARGLVHDLGLRYLLDDLKKPHHSSNRWLLLGDETGIGKELIKSEELINTKGKKFAYIWVLIPPGVFPTQIASDFHAMDQEYFAREHIRVLTNLIDAPEPRLVTFVFETDDYLDVDEKMSDGNDAPSATVLKATLPLIFEYISQHTIKNDDDGECLISTISEQWRWLEAGSDSNFLNITGLDYFDHASARGRGKFRIKNHEIVGKFDHPWLPYADAMGSMTNDPLPKYLENIKKKMNDSIKVLPIHLSFLNNDFPRLANLLSNKPISFLEQLCDVDSKDMYAYMDDIISGMIHHACERFEPFDWVSFNKLMEQKQSSHTGRIIAEQVTNWAVPKLPELLKQLPNDSDRVNMCLTLGWATEQQGGNISPIIQQISPDWLNPETCPEPYQLSLVRLIFSNRQNFFDFDTDSNLLSKSGIFDYPILTPPDMENILQDKSTLTNKNLSILGTFFSSFALQGLKDTSLRESLWESNEILAKFEWINRRDNRRHCIYGGEFAIDCAQHDAKWYEQAHQRLFVDIKYYFATGEGEEEELFWWPAALKYHSLRSDSESHTLEKDECERLIQKARKIARKSPLPVKIRLFYWMARLSEIYGFSDAETHFQDLALLVESHEEIATRDVYVALFYVHLIDLCGRYNSDSTVDFRREFTSALGNCSKTTRLHFSEFLENPDICITDSLKYNYL